MTAEPCVDCRRNPGNKFYYNCMEVAEEPDPNQPWDLKYRYTGYMNTTRCRVVPTVPTVCLCRSGHHCLPWAALDLHWRFPEGDLERDGCRSVYSPPVAYML